MMLSDLTGPKLIHDLFKIPMKWPSADRGVDISN